MLVRGGEGSISSLDTETWLISKGRLAPPLACVSWAHRRTNDDTVPSAATMDSGIYSPSEGLAWVRQQLTSGGIIVSHNASFDMGVAVAGDPSLLPLIFDAYREHRVRCTIVRQKLLDIALGMRKFRHFERDGRQVITKANYHLADLIALFFNERLEKEDTWRLSYALLDGIPLAHWPTSARDYAIKDAVEHLRVYYAQEAVIAEHFGELPNQLEQQRAAWALHLMSMWGVRADAVAVDKFITHCEDEIIQMHEDLADTGIFRTSGKKQNVRNMAEIRRRVVESCVRLSVAVPLTEPSARFPAGQVQTDKDALQSTDDPALHVLAAQMLFAKQLGQWGPVCRAAVHRPVLARYEVLVETGRTACSGSEGQEGTNFQNPDRRGEVRPCFVPRKGWIFCSTDADTIELRAHAQNCLELVGWSKMAEALWDQHQNKGPDLHLRLAANILGIDPYEALARKNEGDIEIGLARQFGKIPNFGFPGGLGARTMITYAAAQLDKVTHQKWFGIHPEDQLTKARWLKDVWLATWPENEDYFEYINGLIGEDGEGTAQHLMSGRIRGGVHYCALANGFFQGRVADAMKEILWILAEECYTGRCQTQHEHGGSSLCTRGGRSILLGSRPSYFLHDEPILEHPEDGTESDRAERQQQVVVEGLSRWLKDIPCTSTAVLVRRWQKGAEPVRVGGLLVPSRLEKVLGSDGKVKIKWVHDQGLAA